MKGQFGSIDEAKKRKKLDDIYSGLKLTAADKYAEMAKKVSL
jgi:hypothetical protein